MSRIFGNVRQNGYVVRDIRAAGPNLLVVTTAIGAAQRVALTLDRINWPEIVGTLSGDDTIFIATTGAAQLRRLCSFSQVQLKTGKHKVARTTARLMGRRKG